MLALDPNWKLAYAEEQWDEEFFHVGVAQLGKVVRVHQLVCNPLLMDISLINMLPASLLPLPLLRQTMSLQLSTMRHPKRCMDILGCAKLLIPGRPQTVQRRGHAMSCSLIWMRLLRLLWMLLPGGE